jgi:hypothetical protein
MHFVLATMAVMAGPFVIIAFLGAAGPGPDSGMPHLLVALAFLPVHAYFYALYFSNLRVVERRWARYFWCTSFWDVPKGQKTLSKMPFSIPLYFLIIDLAIIAAIFMAFMPALENERTRTYTISLLVFVEVLYCFRAIGQAFLQVQWFVSTLEFRISRRSQRWYAWFAMSTLKFISSFFQANWTRFLAICYVGFCAGLCGFLSIMIFMSFLESWRYPLAWFLLILPLMFSVPALVSAVIVMWLLFAILRDLVQRVVWAYSGEGRIRVEDHVDRDAQNPERTSLLHT